MKIKYSEGDPAIVFILADDRIIMIASDRSGETIAEYQGPQTQDLDVPITIGEWKEVIGEQDGIVDKRLTDSAWVFHKIYHHQRYYRSTYGKDWLKTAIIEILAERAEYDQDVEGE